MNWLRKLFALLFALALPGCATTLYAPDERFVTPAMWEVSDKDTTVYLFGTIHALTSDTQWYAGPIEQAYEASDELVTEIALGNAEADAQVIATRALLADGQNLRELMTSDNRAQFEEALIALGLPVGSMDRYEPWYAAMTLTLLQVGQSGFDPQSGAEAALTSRTGGKKQSALETVEQQVELFDGLPMEAQLVFLDETVEATGVAADTLQVMVDRWLAGDAEGLAVLMNDELDDPVLYDRLLTARNARWAEWIARRMEQPGTVFVAVGAGHLAGKGSVQELLRARGVKVRRVKR
jgi:uncharacterized protein YbaP (TraB family)